MVDDDDPKLPFEQAPEGRPADEPDAKTTAEPESEEQKEPTGKPETEASVKEEDVGAIDDEHDEGEGEGEEDEKTTRKRLDRYREQAERQKAEIEALRSRAAGNIPADVEQFNYAVESTVLQKIGRPPKLEDFKEGDYVGYNIARQAYETDYRMTRRNVEEKFVERIQQEQMRVADQIAAHKERVDRFKKTVPDYDEVMRNATLPVASHVERLLLQSKTSERLGYHLGKDQRMLAQLNHMSSEDAARAIGRLEGRLSLPPQSKTQTQARKPITPLRGGGASPPSQLSQVNAVMKKLYPDRYK
jgi:hypothetical protein